MTRFGTSTMSQEEAYAKMLAWRLEGYSNVFIVNMLKDAGYKTRLRRPMTEGGVQAAFDKMKSLSRASRCDAGQTRALSPEDEVAYLRLALANVSKELADLREKLDPVKTEPF